MTVGMETAAGFAKETFAEVEGRKWRELGRWVCSHGSHTGTRAHLNGLGEGVVGVGLGSDFFLFTPFRPAILEPDLENKRLNFKGVRH